jgi:septum formation protein
LTAVAIGCGDQIEQACSVSDVTFAAMSETEIRAYVASGEPMGKAGAYAVQGGAGAFISRINGSYTGIMGLPLYETAQLLKKFA